MKISRREMRKTMKSRSFLMSSLKLRARAFHIGNCLSFTLPAGSLTIITVASMAPSRTAASTPSTSHSQNVPSPRV